MKEILKTTVAAVIVIASLQTAYGSYTNESWRNAVLPDTISKTGGNCYNISVKDIPASPLSESEKEGLIFMREEEKLARDVYVAMAEIWDIPIFNNISRSESTHMEAVLSLLEKYEIPDPVADDKPGVFTNKILADLYQSLVKQGNNSLIDALRAGAFVEETDIADLRERKSKSDNEDIKLVYENLLQASYRHLRAFSKNLAFRGATYQPQRLSKNEFDEILGME
jgi:hypothetical protein